MMQNAARLIIIVEGITVTNIVPYNEFSSSNLLRRKSFKDRGQT